MTTDVQIGRFSIINISSTVGHDARIGDFVTIAPACNILGFAEVGDFTELGANVTVLPKVKVGKHCMIGAGTLVTKDVRTTLLYMEFREKLLKNTKEIRDMSKSVSVCAWTYNQENFVEKMQRSIFEQDYAGSFNLTVADDCSTDNTLENLEFFSYWEWPENRMSVYQPEKNIGAASDFCISKAPKAAYIAFMDGDDQWLPEKLRRSISFLEENNYDMVCTDVMNINPAGEHLGRALDWMNLPQTLTIKELSVDNRIYTSTVIAKMDIILKSPGFLGFGYKVLLDYPLFLWLAARYKIGYLNEALTYKMQNTNSVLHHSNTRDIGIAEYGHQKMNMAQIISTTGRK